MGHSTAAKSFTAGQVVEAFNAALNDIEDEFTFMEEGCLDALNLLLNLGISYLADPANRSMDTVIEQNYSEDASTVKSWVHQA